MILEPSILALFIMLLLFALVTWLFQWLWNITIPELFRAPEITFWQALRLLILASFLFSGETLVKLSVGS